MDTSDGAAAAAGLDEPDAAFFSRSRHRCCCFSTPWQSSSSYARRAVGGGGTGTDGEWWHQVGARADAGAERRRWWRRGVDAFMKVREWSELVAGPRWKTFIRRFRRGHHQRHGGARKLNYDALDYALNFDEGACSPVDGGGGSDYPDFSTRFAAPPGSTRASMDLGARDAQSLFHHHPLPQQPHAPPAITAAARG